MRKRNAYKTVFGVVALATLASVFGLAQTGPQHEHDDPPPRPDMQRPDLARPDRPDRPSRMDGSEMRNEPHHVLAMAYLQSAGAFARALNDQAQTSNQLSSDFARAAVIEISRNLDQADEHQRDHMKTVGDDMRSRMPRMLNEMDTHRSNLGAALKVLEKDVQDYTLNSKRIAADSATVLKYLDDMPGMHRPPPPQDAAR